MRVCRDRAALDFTESSKFHDFLRAVHVARDEFQPTDGWRAGGREGTARYVPVARNAATIFAGASYASLFRRPSPRSRFRFPDFEHCCP